MHNRFPVMLYEGGAVGYAEGGLHDEAMAVKKAGRNGDGRLVHVNDEEFADMVAEYGEPTINPETGMPEFFLGKLGKILKVVAPIALNFIPGVGPLAAAAVGAGLGATGGGGLKGALLGGALGGLGAGGAGGAGAKLGSSVLGSAVSPRLAQALGSAALGAGASAALGGNPLTGALSVGLGNYLRNPMAKVTPGVPTPTTAPSGLPQQELANAVAAAPSAPATALSSLSQQELANAVAAAPVVKPNFWNRNVSFLGKMGTDLGLKNKHAILAGGLLAAGAAEAMKPKGAATDEAAAREKFFGPSFSAKPSDGGFRLASLSSPSSPSMPESIMADYGKRYFNGFAYGGDVDSFAVKGPGTGRSDEIPAMLSDGEYVIDAETVALLGDGSSKAGAKKLDDLRVKIRKHKGKKLAKGKFSHDAKPADKYMAGGRI